MRVLALLLVLTNLLSGADPRFAALSTELKERASRDGFSGTVVVARGAEILFSGAYGWADRRAKVPNRMETRFRIGSMNKMFTAAAVLQLAQAGKLKLTDAMGKYVPDYPNREMARKVTIHHLLTHTGGAGDIFGPAFPANRTGLRTLEDYVALYGRRPLEFEPGTRFSYSNFGFILLGVIVGKVSGEGYYDYVRGHIYGPAEMTSTDSAPETELVPHRSAGYTGRDLQSNAGTLPYRGTSAGGGYSTAGDLVRFARALVSHKLLNAKYTDLLTTGRVEMGPGVRYAYGFMDSTRNGVHWFGHGGGAPGMNGELRIYARSGEIVAVLSNLDPPAAIRVAELAESRLTR